MGRRKPVLPIDIAILLGLATCLLIALQAITLPKFGAIPPAKHFVTLQNFLRALHYYDLRFSYTDCALIALLLCCGLGCLVLELFRQRLTLFFNWVFDSRRRTVGCLAAGSLVLVRFYFSPGASSWAADTSLHTAYAWVAAQAFASGEWPIWTNYFACGSPYLQFYGCLFFYAVGALDLLIRDHFTSIKFVMALGHVLSGLGMFAYVQSTTGSRRAGFFAGLAYVLCFWHTQQVLIMGRLPLSIFYALMPWPFWAFERLRLNHNRDIHIPLGALALAGLAFTHPGYGFWATAFLGLYIALRHLFGCRRIPLWNALALFLGGLVLSACLTLPMWLERGSTGLFAGFQMTQVKDPNWQQLLFWSNHRFALFATETSHTHWYGGYLGVSLVIFALCGIVGIGRSGPRRKYIGIPLGLCLLGALLLVFGYRWPIMRDLSVVQALNAGRYLLFVTFFMSALTGLGMAWIMRFLKRPTRAFSMAIALLMIDLFPTTFQHLYLPDSPDSPELVDLSPAHHASLKAAWPHRPNGELPPYRIFYTTAHTYPAVVIAWFTTQLGMPSSYDLYNEHPLAGPAFTHPFTQLASDYLLQLDNPRDILIHPTGLQILKGLHLLNVRHVLIPQPDKQKTLKWKLSHNTPILVSNRVTGWPDMLKAPPAERKRLVSDLLNAYGNLDETSQQCTQIPLANFRGAEQLDTNPSVTVFEHRVWNQRTKMRIRVTKPCYARLSYAHYPTLQVLLDGKRIAPLVTADRFIALKLDAGEHTIELHPELSVLRKVLLGLNAALLMAAIGFIAYARRPTSK